MIDDLSASRTRSTIVPGLDPVRSSPRPSSDFKVIAAAGCVGRTNMIPDQRWDSFTRPTVDIPCLLYDINYRSRPPSPCLRTPCCSKGGGSFLSTHKSDISRSGDILIADGKIARVAKSIEDPRCRGVRRLEHDRSSPASSTPIVTLGKRRSKSMSSDWSLPEYLAGIRGRIGPRFTPEDVYAATLLGATEALNAGVTTLVDWAHIMNSPGHADGSVAALKEFGGRAVFAYGTPNDEHIAEWYIDSTIPHSDDIRRVRDEELPTDDGW